MKGLSADYQISVAYAASLFHLLLKLLHSLVLPARNSVEDIALRKNLGLCENEKDADFVAFWFGKLILFNSRRIGNRYWGLTAEECDFLEGNGKKDTWQPGAGGLNLVPTKIKVAQFLASGAFKDEERFLPALFASADSNSHLSDVGNDMMKRASPSISLEDSRLVDKLLDVYLGTGGAEGPLPAPAQLQIKILALLCKSKASSSFVAKNIQLVREGLVPAAEHDQVKVSGPTKEGLEASRRRGQVLAYTNWLARSSSSTDIKAIAPALVGQLRAYIDSQGWPRYRVNETENANGLSSRRSAYETIGLLAAACPNYLLLEPNLDLLRWLLSSLSGDPSGKETSISIEQALSSVINTFGTPLSMEIEAPLTDLLLHHVSLRVGDIQGSGDKVVRSTRFVAVRFANRCLPFHNPTARFINVLALNGGASEPKEVREEGSKGLDPYWHRILNGHQSHLSTTDECSKTVNPTLHQLPEFSALVTRFYGVNGDGKTRVDNMQSVAADAAALFCRTILVHQALESERLTPEIDVDWERKLGALIENDGSARQAVSTYLEKTSQDALNVFLEILLSSITVESQPPKIRSAKAFLELLSVAPDSSVSFLAPKAVLLTNAIYSSEKTMRKIASNAFGILGSHPQSSYNSVQNLLATLERKSASWRQALGAEVLATYGAILALAFYISRTFHRGRSSKVKDIRQHFLQVSLDIITDSHDSLLLEAATSSIAELSAFAALTVDSFPAPYGPVKILQNLKRMGQGGDERAISAIGYLGMHCYGNGPDDVQLFARASSPKPMTIEFDSIVEILYSLHEIRQAEVQFAIGGALSCAAVGWKSTYMVAKLDTRPLTPGPNSNVASLDDAYVSAETTSIDRLGPVIDRVLEDCTTTKPALRQASVIWLLCLVQYCGQLHGVESRLRECQVAFRGFLSDKDSLNRETAARGLSLVYEKSDRATKDDLVRELVSSFTGDRAGLAGNVSDQTELFEPGALPTGENQSITTYKDIMSLAAEVGDPSLVYRFMSMAANNAIWTSRATFGHFGLSSILSDSNVDGYLAKNPKLYPALFRYRFDPNPNVRSSMDDLWKKLVKEPAAVIDENFDSIMEDLLKSIIGREWRVRQASCAAIADLVQGRLLEKYEKFLHQIWTLTYKVLLVLARVI